MVTSSLDHLGSPILLSAIFEGVSNSYSAIKSLLFFADPASEIRHKGSLKNLPKPACRFTCFFCYFRVLYMNSPNGMADPVRQGPPPPQKGWNLFLLLILGGWLVLNLLQSAFTQLELDEPYYWYYAQELAWGYFDHPPGVALMIFLSDGIFSGELRVRFVTVLLSTASLYLLWILAGKPQKRGLITLLFLILLAQPFLHIYAFVTTPDPPLLFFTALFFVLYLNFLKRNDAWSAIALGFCSALLLYSKYHGILIVGFTFLSNWKLLRQRHFYLIALVGVLSFLPHLYWQFANDFPSVRYHLVERNEPFKLKDPITYFLNQLIIFSPFLFPFMVSALSRREKPENQSRALLERAYYFNILGFWLFFLPFTLRGHIEPQWTAPLSIPLALLLYAYALGKDRFRKRVLWAGGISMGLLLLLRLPILDLPLTRSLPMMHYNDWIAPLKKEAGKRPVIFLNEYRAPARFQFYTGTPTASITTTRSVRGSQYDLRNWEKGFHHKPVLIAGPDSTVWKCSSCIAAGLSGGANQLLDIDSMEISNKVEIAITPSQASWRAGDTVTLDVHIFNPYPHDVRLDREDLPVGLYGAFLPVADAWEVSQEPLEPGLAVIRSGFVEETRISFPVPEDWVGQGPFGLSLGVGQIIPALPRSFIDIEVQPAR